MHYKNSREVLCYCGGPFGEVPVEVDADGKVIDASTVEVFTRGQCHAFALAVNEMTGWPLAAISYLDTETGDEDVDADDPNLEPAHIVAVTPEGKLLDINGLKAKQKIDSWNRGFKYRVQPTTPARVHTFETYLQPDMEAARPFARTVLTREGYGGHIR